MQLTLSIFISSILEAHCDSVWNSIKANNILTYDIKACLTIFRIFKQFKYITKTNCVVCVATDNGCT